MSSTSPALFLFDIDGTLLSTGGSGYRSFTRSCREVLGILGPLNGISMAGKLDRMIFQEIVEHFRPDLAEKELTEYWLSFKEKYIEYLRAESLDPGSWTLMPGVAELVEFTASLGSLALLTGNVRDGAKIKLSVLGLAKYFPTGGFGEQTVSRPRLAEITFAEACSYYGIEFSPERTFVLGDTAHDIQAAKAIRARSIAVATGTVSAQDLASAGADLLVENFLTGAQKVRRFISGQ